MKFFLDSDGDIDLGDSEWAFLNNITPEKANLLVSSPDMYEALVDLINAWPEDDCDKLRAAAAALAKAEGRPNATTD